LWLLDENGQLDTAAIEQSMRRDATTWTDAVAQVIDAIADRPDVDPNRLAVDGYSLGGFIALAAAERCQADPELPDVRTVVVNWAACFENAEFDNDFPPTLFVHGEFDRTVPLELARETMQRLVAVGVDADICIVPHAAHVAASPESRQRTLAFLQQNLLSTATAAGIQ
jgi:dipeptidyl aminopeptidase/acylaminoacyl peptidase